MCAITSWVQRLPMPWMSKFVRFASVGVVGTAVHYVTLGLLVSLMSVRLVAATTCGFTLGALVNYALNRRFTFQSQASHRSALTKFMIVAVCGAALNAAIVSALSTRVSWHYLLIQMVATGVVLLWNFVANAVWTFKH